MIKYNRPDFDEIKIMINELISNLEKPNDFNTFLNNFKEIIKLQNHIEEMFDHCDIQNMRHQNDEKYIIEMNYGKNNILLEWVNSL